MRNFTRSFKKFSVKHLYPVKGVCSIGGGMFVGGGEFDFASLNERIDRDTLLANVASLMARRSTCLRLQVGAVVALQGRILVTGYNGAPSGMPHCTPDICGKDKPCTRTVHAEANCIAFAARHGISLEGGFMYCTDSPCMECAKLIINSGIKGLFYQREYRDRKPIDLLIDAGVLTIL